MAKKSSTTGFREMITEIRKKNFAHVYILMGDEDYYIDKAVEALESLVVNEDERDFNNTVFYGADAEIMQIISRAQQYPVMADRQLVILKEAQSMQNSKKELEKLLPYVNHSNPNTVLVVTYKGDSLGANSPLVKAVMSNKGVVFNSVRPKDYQLAGPVGDYCREKGIAIDDRAVSLLCEYLGSPLAKLFGEIDKLSVAAGDTKKITTDLIEAVTGISKEFNTFELIKAISIRDYFSAMKILDYFTKNPKQNPVIMIVATLFNFFSKLFVASLLKDKSDTSLLQALDLKNAYFLTDYKNGLRNYSATTIDSIIHSIRETDAKSKGIGSSQNEYDLLKELVFKIFTLR